jgi:hypothetical protein
VATNTIPVASASARPALPGLDQRQRGVHEARVGVNAVPMNAPDWQDWKNKQAWIGATIFDCDKTFFHLYCLEI